MKKVKKSAFNFNKASKRSKLHRVIFGSEVHLLSKVGFDYRVRTRIKPKKRVIEVEGTKQHCV